MGKVFFLIVDDDQVLPRLLIRLARKFFKSSEYDVHLEMFHSGPKAIEFATHMKLEHPDAEWGLVSDYDMPNMNGAQLIDALDTLLGEKIAFRLILTGDIRPDRKDEVEAKQAFIDAKPIDKRDFDSYLYQFLMALS